jgi:hypothetical protein
MAAATDDDDNVGITPYHEHCVPMDVVTYNTALGVCAAASSSTSSTSTYPPSYSISPSLPAAVPALTSVLRPPCAPICADRAVAALEAKK